MGVHKTFPIGGKHRKWGKKKNIHMHELIFTTMETRLREKGDSFPFKIVKWTKT